MIIKNGVTYKITPTNKNAQLPEGMYKIKLWNAYEFMVDSIPGWYWLDNYKFEQVADTDLIVGKTYKITARYNGCGLPNGTYTVSRVSRFEFEVEHDPSNDEFGEGYTIDHYNFEEVKTQKDPVAGKTQKYPVAGKTQKYPIAGKTYKIRALYAWCTLLSGIYTVNATSTHDVFDVFAVYNDRFDDIWHDIKNYHFELVDDSAETTTGTSNATPLGLPSIGPNDDIVDRVKEIIIKDGRIHAIGALYRGTRIGLKNSKNIVDAIHFQMKVGEMMMTIK